MEKNLEGINPENNNAHLLKTANKAFELDGEIKRATTQL